MLYTTDPGQVSSGKLLSQPHGEQRTFSRSASDYQNNSDKFELKERNFQRQYAHVYSSRLLVMWPKLKKAAQNKWGNDFPIKKMFELKVDEKCVIIGTLFQHQQLKPSILREISDEHDIGVPPPKLEKFTDEGDELIMEDELQRIKLVGNIDAKHLATGAIVAVLGKERDEDRGKFQVEDICYQTLPDQPLRPQLDEDKYVALISGLDLGTKQDNVMTVQMMVDLLTGQLGDEDQQSATARVVRVIVAGNSLSKETQDKQQLSKAKYLTKNTTATTVDAVKCTDDFLVQLAACVDVDLMPGQYDPCNYVMPQQPLHRCMFPQAAMYPTLNNVTNPYDCSVHNVRFLGTSGQPVEDIYKFSHLEDRLEILERTLLWGHLAPTAPDTLGCYPYHDDDPFIIHQCPHVYFAANQPQFQTKLLEGASGQQIRIICIPRFSQTSTCVLVNLRTLECQPLTFRASFNPPQQESPEVDK